MIRTKSILAALTALVSVVASTGAARADEHLTLRQVNQRLYGNDLRSPAPDSAVGKYVAETKASWVVRKFANAPVGNEIPAYQMGPERLVVAVGPDSFEAFKKHFSSIHYLYQIYEPNDTRMVVGFEGKRGTEGHLRDQMNYSVAGTLMTPILLDSDEGARAKRFFALAEIDTRRAASPWLLKSAQGEPYSAMSAYLGCTHWFGGMPIGNTRVNAYVYPSGDEDPKGEKPNTKNLVQFETPNMPENVASLVRDVWQAQGFQQLGEMLKPDAFRRGEFANPGWIAFTLTGSVDAERIPVVFVMTDDETAPLAADFPVGISAN